MKFCGENKNYKADYFDPLGPNKAGVQAPTGGPEAREQLFGELRGVHDQASQAAGRAASATEAAASSPVWGQAQRVLSDNMSGRNLAPNPYLTDALRESREAADTRLGTTREQALADTEGQMAATRAASERNGVTFGTGAQQAQDATRAAVSASLGRGEQQATADIQANEAAQLAENYALERGYQTSSAGMAPGVTAGQAQLLQSVPGQYYEPITQSAEIVRGLAGGGQAIQPTIVRKPGVFDYGTQLLSATGSAAGGW